MTIGYGFDQPIVSSVQPFLYNTDLIAKVAFQKQQQYDVAYEGLQNLKSQALNISFLNKKEQGKIDAFNKEVETLFKTKNGEFGDLSKGNIVQQYTSLFEKIGSDVNLVGRYKKEGEIRSQLQSVEEKRNSKDPTKAGYSNINYKNYLARVQEYSDLDLDKPENANHVVQPYTDYVDYNKIISDRIKKEIPIEKFSEDVTVNGYIRTVTKVGRDPNKVRRLVEDYMKGEAGVQLREEAEYMWRNYKDNPDAWKAVYNDHTTYTDGQKRIIDEQLTNERAKLKNPSLSADERSQIAGNVAALERKSGELAASITSPDDFFRRGKEQVIGDIANVYTFDKISAISNSAGGYATSTTLKPDQTLLTFQKMKVQAQQFNAKMQQDAAIAAMREKGLNERAMLSSQVKLNDNSSNERSSQGGGANNVGGVEGLSTEGVSASQSQPLVLKWGSNMEEVQGSLTKSYTTAHNVFESGMWHGNSTIPADKVAFDFIASPDKVTGNIWYNDNVYMQAGRKVLDDIYKTRPDLARYIGVKPAQNDNDGWNAQKEIIKILKERTKQMVENPSNPDEHQYANRLQEANANRIAINNYMERARKHGNPIEFFQNNMAEVTYPNARYDFDMAEGLDKDTKSAIANNLTRIHASLESNINRNAENVADGLTQIRDIPKEFISAVEIGANGNVQVYFRPSAFEQKVTKNLAKAGKDGEDAVSQMSGPLSDEKRFIRVQDPTAQGGFRRVSVADIKSKGYLEYTEPKFNKVNTMLQLGLDADATPQQYWDSAKDANGNTKSVPFKIRKSTLNNNIEVQVGEGGWVNLNTGNAEEAMQLVRQQIRSTPFENIR